ncbi:MAG: hypothetical protein ACLQBY_01330 [Solirubrobacteraceae bacterium]
MDYDWVVAFYVEDADLEAVLSRWLADPHLDNIACLADDIVDCSPSKPAGYTKLSGSARMTTGSAQRTVLSTGNCLRVLRSQLIAAGRAAMNEVRGRLEVAVQHKRIEVCTVGPHDGPQVVVHANLRKEVGLGPSRPRGAYRRCWPGQGHGACRHPG